MLAESASLILILALVSGQTSASAVKGHANGQQRSLEQQAPVKSPAVQQALLERQAKSAPAQPILESSKKVYNDESIRRSAQQQLVNEPMGKSAPVQPAVVAAPVAPVVAVVPVVPVVKQPVQPVVVPAAAEPVQAPIVSVGKPEVGAVVEAKKDQVVEANRDQVAEEKKDQVESKSSAAASPVEKQQQQPKVEQPVEKAEPLPAPSVRSAPVKEEASRVIVEQVVPAKSEQPQLQQRVYAAPVVEQPAAVSAPVNEPAGVVKVAAAVAEQPAVPVAPQVAQVAEQPKQAAQAADSPLEARKDEQPQAPAAAPESPIEVPAPDPGLVLSEPIDSTTKLLIDLDEHVQKFLPAEDKQDPQSPPKEQILVSGVDYSPSAAAEQVPSGKSGVPLVPYSSSAVNEHEPIVPPLPQAIDKVEKAAGAAAPLAASSASDSSSVSQANTRQATNNQNQNQQQVIKQLLDQLDQLQARIQETINQLVARRRYVMSALLRPMGTYVRRVRTNLERLQNRVNQLQAAASSVGGNQNGQRPGGFVDAAAIETIRKRIDDISKRISDIVNRIRSSLIPTSAPMNSNGRK